MITAALRVSAVDHVGYQLTEYEIWTHKSGAIWGRRVSTVKGCKPHRNKRLAKQDALRMSLRTGMYVLQDRVGSRGGPLSERDVAGVMKARSK